jgi:hypothetical protein
VVAGRRGCFPTRERIEACDCKNHWMLHVKPPVRFR